MTEAEVEAIVMSFPETEAGFAYRNPCWKSFGKFLTRIRSEDASVVLAEVSFDEREMLLEVDGETFHFTDHYRNFPYVLARIANLDPDQFKAFLTRRWRKNAPKSWLKAWDGANMT